MAGGLFGGLAIGIKGLLLSRLFSGIGLGISASWLNNLFCFFVPVGREEVGVEV